MNETQGVIRYQDKYFVISKITGFEVYSNYSTIVFTDDGRFTRLLFVDEDAQEMFTKHLIVVLGGQK